MFHHLRSTNHQFVCLLKPSSPAEFDETLWSDQAPHPFLVSIGLCQRPRRLSSVAQDWQQLAWGRLGMGRWRWESSKKHLKWWLLRHKMRIWPKKRWGFYWQKSRCDHEKLNVTNKHQELPSKSVIQWCSQQEYMWYLSIWAFKWIVNKNGIPSGYD